VGSVCTLYGGVDLVAWNTEAFVAGSIIWVTAITAFYCAFTLRKIIVSGELQNPIS